MIEAKTVSELNAWSTEADYSVSAELKSFATGLLSELHSVENASSGDTVECNINKLKTIKDQMYRNASFDLLRKDFYYYRIDQQKWGRTTFSEIPTQGTS